MVSTVTSLSALLIGFAMLCLGHGLNNTLLGVRSVQEGFPDWAIALMTSSYFAGFLLGTRLSTLVLERVGHIRTFATFASIASAASLAYLLALHEWGWITVRFVYGMCMAANYVALESWLNGLSDRSTRGSVLSVYMMVNFLSLGAAQGLMLLGDAGSHELFLVVSILMSLALVPVSISRRQPPHIGAGGHVSLRLLKRMNRPAMLGVTGLGLALGAYWGLGAAYLSRAGMGPEAVARFLGAGFLGGLILQWPLGRLSDQFDRRIVLAGTLLLAFTSSGLIGAQLMLNWKLPPAVLMTLALLYGGSSYTLYSMLVALANDYLGPEDLVGACAGLIMLQAIGSLVGPFLVAGFALFLGPSALFIVSAAIYAVVLVGIATDFRQRPHQPEATHTHFTAVPRTSAMIAELDERGDSEGDEVPANPEPTARPA